MKNIVVSFVSQKGGVGKSTLVRAFATGAMQSGFAVKVADLDTQQATVTDWHRQRLNNGYKPVGSIEVFRKTSEAVGHANNYDFLVLDGAARASVATLEISKASDLVVIPSCASRDDLMPAVKLAHELQKNEIPLASIIFALTRVTTESEIEDARSFIEASGYAVLNGCLYEKPGYRQAQNEGLSVLETRFRSLNEKADELIDSIISHLS
uniref:Chromosome partitioning protein n=1 Tax=Candidatus Kentrum sp. FM TaxID=2126340 RepID=A0A450WB89_9GAMM|nr:MAG: chromosome partitioning protein [Candidatus Kentron sp. FM]VFJ62963.1 MAG: chromosome partitioning protein [Candidatus Kentron sp. FM]VFK14313.1 MAG: chromosome partitioning protein [Candidatus Kentron sp. FM]